jgi:hypothetical protein
MLRAVAEWLDYFLSCIERQEAAAMASTSMPGTVAEMMKRFYL